MFHGRLPIQAKYNAARLSSDPRARPTSGGRAQVLARADRGNQRKSKKSNSASGVGYGNRDGNRDGLRCSKVP
jgi:hypothetical protein